MNTMTVKEPRNDLEVDNRGRPCKYDTHVEPYLDKVYKWLKEGYTEYSIAEQLSIHPYTFARYKQEFSALNEVFTRARTEKCSLVMHKQYEKAIGYEHKDMFIAQYQGKIVEKEIIKYYPPDVNAADLYLRNNSEDYKSAKADAGNLTLIQNNFQLPELKQQLLQIEQELKKLESGTVVEVEVIERD
jgi:hypothetical protein